MAEEPLVDVWEPDTEGATDAYHDVSLSDDEELKIRIRSDQRGRMVAFAIVRRRKLADGWKEIARADTAHQSVHIDLLDRRGEKVGQVPLMASLGSFADVIQGFGLAYDSILDHAAVTAHIRKTWGSGLAALGLKGLC